MRHVVVQPPSSAPASNLMSAGGNRPPEWLSTHPDPQARIAELQARANQLLPVYEQARAAGRRPQCG